MIVKILYFLLYLFILAVGITIANMGDPKLDGE